MIARSSPKDAVPIANDVPFLEGVSSAIYVGTGGNITCVMESGKTATFYGVPGGGWFPVAATMVLGGGTTASQLVAGYY